MLVCFFFERYFTYLYHNSCSVMGRSRSRTPPRRGKSCSAVSIWLKPQPLLGSRLELQKRSFYLLYLPKTPDTRMVHRKEFAFFPHSPLIMYHREHAARILPREGWVKQLSSGSSFQWRPCLGLLLRGWDSEPWMLFWRTYSSANILSSLYMCDKIVYSLYMFGKYVHLSFLKGALILHLLPSFNHTDGFRQFNWGQISNISICIPENSF